MWKFIRASVVLLIVVASTPGLALSAELPVLHLRKASTPPPLVSRLQDPATASAWYPSSPTWFGLGGKTGDRNHTEVLATYDDTALYIAFLNIDRSTVVYPQNTTTDLKLIDSNEIWIETPQGRRFCLIAAVDDRYPAQPRRASGEFPIVDGLTDRLSGWSSKGWFAGNMTIQQTIVIPWTTFGTTAPAQASKWRVNFVNNNQTSTARTAATVRRQTWAPGDEGHPERWGTLAFDEGAFTPPAVSPEATITMRPATGFGGEVTLRAGNDADGRNHWADEAVTQSNWNDWDPVDYTIKEYLQFDLSLIPQGRKIISATLRNYCRSNFNSNPKDLYLHVVRLADEYDPATVTMLTSPLPVENGSRILVGTSQAGTRVDFDITDVVTKAYESGARKAVFALAGSSGDTNNGKIWGVSYGRADWYESQRPRLVVTFGKPGTTFPAPIQLGTFNSTSVATTANKNKLTNGTFRYGIVEGIANTTYWQDSGQVYVGGRNIAMMQKFGDVNPNTGNPALRIVCAVAWKSIRQTATGLVGGRSYTFSGWFKGSASGVKSDVRLNFRDASGTSLATAQAVYSGSGNWEKLKLTKAVPAGVVTCDVDVFNDTAGTGTYMLYSDFQLEEGTAATAYSETMGVYYPDYPRTDGTGSTTGTPNVQLTLAADKTQAVPGEAITYTISYRNAGDDPATSIEISCPVPANTTYVPGSGGIYDSPARTVRWTIPSLPPGESGTLTFKVTVD